MTKKEQNKQTGWEQEFDRWFVPRDIWRLGEHNLRVKGRADEVKQFIRGLLQQK